MIIAPILLLAAQPERPKLTPHDGEIITKECNLPVESLNFRESGEVWVSVPANAQYNDVDCMLGKLKAFTAPIFFIGNERSDR